MSYEIERVLWVEGELERYEQKNGWELDVHSRGVLRSMKQKEYDWWQREAVRVDNNNSHDDQ